MKNELKGLPKTVTEAPQLYLNNICTKFAINFASRINDGGLNPRISDADQEFKNATKAAVAQFGLADRSEIDRGIVRKSANDFLFNSVQGCS